MFLKDLIGVTQGLLSNCMPRNMWQVDVSTIRYYDRMGLLSKAEKVSRNNIYNDNHLRELVLLKIMQYNGLSLSEIQQEMKAIKDSNVTLKDVLEKTYFVPDNLIQSAIEGIAAVHEPETDSSKKEEEKKMTEEHEVKTLWEKTPTVTTRFCEAEILDFEKFKEMNVQNQINLGSVFAFVNTKNETFAKETHKLLYGQKKKGSVNKATLYVDEELELPSVKLKPSITRIAVGAVLSDKDIYQEGTIAKIFALIPQAKNKKVKVRTLLQHVMLDNFEVQMDKNGCVLFRVPVLTSGKYQILINDGDDMFTCEFDGAKYRLTPLVISAESKNVDSSFQVNITATKYGAKFNGEAKIRLECGYRRLSQCDVTFKDGFTFVSWPHTVLPEDQLMLVVQDSNDSKLIASTPLTGSKKFEREDLEVSHLGHVVSVSMIPSSTSMTSRSLHFKSDLQNNSPILLKSCISKSIDLEFRENASEICVAVYDPLRKTTEQYQWANCKAGKTLSIKPNSEFAVFHVGCFFNDQPWEGHGFVARPSCDEFSHVIEMPTKILPSSKLSIKIKTSKPASLLLKISDKRVKSIYEPVSKIASSLKSHLNIFNYLHFGAGRMPTVKVNSPWLLGNIEPAVYRSAINSSQPDFYSPLHTPQDWAIDNVTWESRTNATIRSMFNSNESNSVLRCKSSNPVELTACNFSLPDSTIRKMRGYSEPRGLYGPMGFSGFSGVSGFSGCAGPTGYQNVETEAARKSVQDSLYYDLIQVDGEKTIEIKVPDIIGTLEVKALFISGLDWAEASHDLRVEKPIYIEPFIPQFCHEEDEIYCKAVVVGTDLHTEKTNIQVKVNGKKSEFKLRSVGDNIYLTWKAVAGTHEISVQQNQYRDSVIRVVESPSEETVLTQEIRIIKPKKTYSIFDEDAISIAMLPSMEEELGRVVSVCADYQHCCCEQTSAQIIGAALAIITGDDGSRDKGLKSFIAGEARFKTLFNGQAFRYYPGTEVRYWANKVACARLKRISKMLSDTKLPDDAQKALNSIKQMIEVADKFVPKDNSHMVDDYYKQRLQTSPMETAYLEGKKTSVAGAAKDFLKQENLGNYPIEACYCVALLVKSKQIDLAIDLANKVSKSTKGLSGWFGTDLAMAYMSMVYELTKAQIISSGKNAKVIIDEKEVLLQDALNMSNITKVTAKQNAVLIRVNRLVKLKYDNYLGKLPMSVGLSNTTLKSGDPVTLNVKLPNGYQDGDVLMVMLPECLSRMVGGGQVKKFEVDFAGKDQLSIDLAVTEKTEKPQKWGCVVRNMYNNERIGCVGLMSANVSE